jgi:parallel beta-helix repeat protein
LTLSGGNILLIFGLLSVLLGSTASNAANYYVAQTGSNRSSGTSWDSAWRTLEHAGKMAGPGDTVTIRKGAEPYRYLPIGNSGTEGKSIVFRGELPTDRPIITGARRIDKWRKSEHPGVWRSSYEKKVTMLMEDGNYLGPADSPRCLRGGWYWDGEQIYYRPSDESPDKHEIWINGASGGAVMRSQSWLELRDLHFWFGGGAGVSIKNGHHILIDNVRVEWHWRGIDLQGNSTHNIVDGCDVSNNREGIYLSFGASHNAVRNCSVTNNGNLPIWTEGDRAGIAIGVKGPNRGNVIENNEVSYNGGTYSDPGLIAYEAPDTIIRNNNVHHNYGNGLYVTIHSDGSRVVGNRVAFNGIPAIQSGEKGVAGLSIRVSRDVLVENNHIINNHVSRDSRWPGKGLGPRGGLDVQGLPGQDMTNLVFRNNIISGTVGGPDFYINPAPDLRGLKIAPREQAPSSHSSGD